MAQANPPGIRFLGFLTQVTDARRQEVLQAVTDISTPRFSFYIMVVISAIIAAYGLLANSTAVVIGAMLVAPLMGPIFGLALSLVAGDRALLGRSSIAEIFGIILAVSVGMVIGLVPLRPDFGTEILGRTQPTIYDIIIAVASALAGTYALIDPRISPALPGVAMATALVPPLVTCGLCLAAREWPWALGALLLFVANFLSIEITAAIVFAIFGMAKVYMAGEFTVRRFLRRFGLSLVALAIIGTFMTQTLFSIIAERRLRQALEKTLAEALRSSIGATLDTLRYERDPNGLNVSVVVLTPQEFDTKYVESLEVTLRTSVDPTVHLVAQTVLTTALDRNGPVFQSEKERSRRTQVAAQTQFLAGATQVLTTQLQAVPGARLLDVRRDAENEQSVLRAVVRTPQAITPEHVKRMQEAVQETVKAPVHLLVRSVPVREADTVGYLYEAPTTPAPLSGEALALQQRCEAIINEQLAASPGTHLLALHLAQHHEVLRLVAVVRTPRAFEPQQVQPIEAALQQQVSPQIALVVRSVVGTDATAAGYLSALDSAQLLPAGADAKHVWP